MPFLKSSFALSIFSFAAFAPNAFAQSDLSLSDGGDYRVLTLSITGTAQAQPDRAILSSGVSAIEPTAREAIAANAKKMNALFDALKKIGVERRFVQTSRVMLTQQFSYNSGTGQPRVPTGYEARNDISIRLTDIQDSGGVIDALVTAGADRINGPTFTINDDSDLVQEARKDAMEQAMKLSQFYAVSTGHKRADIIAIDESSGFRVDIPLSNVITAGGRPGFAAETPVEAGDVQRSVSVTVRYRLVP
ncbi:SIMPL domain-containing protein [Sphingorhabdus arenilitoris]|uniref:SIMPL domain-containing protein n=1 Tax=Sphingorhabdus arenilitoris TaxID=1490041 RepID=A0ABV8RG77_9SPHN